MKGVNLLYFSCHSLPFFITAGTNQGLTEITWACYHINALNQKPVVISEYFFLVVDIKVRCVFKCGKKVYVMISSKAPS